MSDVGQRNDDSEFVSVIYLSRATAPFDHTALSHLATESSLANERSSVTGYLTFNEPFFTQYLEGPETAVTDVFDRVSADERHEVTRIVHLGKTERRFPNWSMKLISPSWQAVDGPIQTIHEVLSVDDSDADASESLRASLNHLVSVVSRLQ